MSVPSSEFGSPHPLSRKRVCLPPGIKGGGTLGLWVRVPIRTTGENAYTVVLCLSVVLVLKLTCMIQRSLKERSGTHLTQTYGWRLPTGEILYFMIRYQYRYHAGSGTLQERH